ncbi:uncharacterized protein LOC111387362 [Olea europaea var. sylvestris]|uniref:uncharacterized protein LOC111387362 n=1 Tax=Olea europaea var. sylvestris TaxID=158386 RepID=UPI000C1CE619|nr:uncharacterized protein LOC111387362 [Olea europaea var. sylvestris]
MKMAISSMTMVLKKISGFKLRVRGHLLGRCGLGHVYFLTSQNQKRSWWASLVKDFVINGVDGSWNDMNEPAVMKTEMKTMLESKIHRGDPQHGGKQNHSHYHNVLLGPEIFYKHFNFTHEIDMLSVIYALERSFLILYQAIYKSQASFFLLLQR